MLHVIPITDTRIDWQTYLATVNDTLNRSPTIKLDEKWIELNYGISDYLSTLKEIIKPGSDPYNKASSLLEHVHIGFLIIGTKQTVFQIIIESRLPFSIAESKHNDFILGIVSGTLTKWRTAILNCCSEDVHHDVRLFGSKIFECFEKVNIRQFIDGITKIPMSDGTIRLMEYMK